jgi:hypothetical protein
MTFLNCLLPIRIREEEYKELKRIYRSDREKYFNVSHVVRVAIMQFIKGNPDESLKIISIRSKKKPRKLPK